VVPVRDYALRPPLEHSAGHRAHLRVADALLPVGVALWAVGVARTNDAVLGQYGLPANLPIIFYAGLALALTSAAIELSRSRPSQWRLALHSAVLVVMLYATAPLVYQAGRYSWLYKTVGVVQYINVHGKLNRHIDIYQNWPGFFALAAWFGKVSGTGTPLAYAKWFQVAVELAALPLLYLIYDALSLTIRQRWTAILLYSASNWVAQDYFSPQAVGTLMSLAVMAMTLRWLYVESPPRFRGRRQQGTTQQIDPMEYLLGLARRQPDEGSTDLAGARGDRPGSTAATAGAGGRNGAQHRSSQEEGQPQSWRKQSRATTASYCAAIMLAYFVLCFTHELTPYVIALQLGLLALIRVLKPRWLPVALAAIAVGYLLPRFTFVNSHYGLLNSLGNFFGNASPDSFLAASVSPGEKLVERSAELLSVGIWGLAALGAWRHRKSGRSTLSLALLAYSPILLLAVLAYGHEGILRVYLYSLPWSVALVALALTPPPREPVRRTAGARPEGPPDSLPARGSVRGPGEATRRFLRALPVLALAVTLFLPAFYGDDSFNKMPQAEVTTVGRFLQQAKPGPIYCAIDNAPLADTYRYNQFSISSIFGVNGVAGSLHVKSNIVTLVEQDSLKYTDGTRPAYIMIAPTMLPYSTAYGVTAPGSFQILFAALNHSPNWKLIVDQSGVIIYELPPKQSTAKTGVIP
jgi:hypothetical protein